MAHSTFRCIRKCGLALAAAAGLAACDDGYPRDPGGTTAGVRDSGIVRVGVEASAGEAAALALARRIADAAGAEPHARTEPLETLLRDLERGELDVVVVNIAADSPWSSRIYFLPVQVPDDVPVLRPLVRKGENGWIMLVDRVYRR